MGGLSPYEPRLKRVMRFKRGFAGCGGFVLSLGRISKIYAILGHRFPASLKRQFPYEIHVAQLAIAPCGIAHYRRRN